MLYFIECKDLIKIYPTSTKGLKFPALRGLNFNMEKGELVSIIGPSGSGKTTFLRLLGGLELPSSGEIWIEGQLLNTFSSKRLMYHRRQVALMFQSPKKNLVWQLKALDNVLLPMWYFGLNQKNKSLKAYELLEKVGLKSKARRKPSQLSGGEQQRLAIAVALAHNPKLLLADEPTGQLDSQTTSIIIDYFQEVNQELGTTIIVVTHDKRFSRMTKKTYTIKDGKLTDFQFRKNGQHLEVLVVIDKHGNLTLPKEVLSQFKNYSLIKIQIAEDHIKLFPVWHKIKEGK